MLFAGNTDCSQQNKRRHPRNSERHTGTIDFSHPHGKGFVERSLRSLSNVLERIVKPHSGVKEIGRVVGRQR